jgi:hypothetical protein
MNETKLEKKLDKLFSYHETGHDFDTEQVNLLIEAINNCKIPDPACGSGASPWVYCTTGCVKSHCCFHI